jgi:hypothetical protein
MGWQVDGACYATQLQAVQAAVSREVGKVVSIGTASYVVDVTATTATSATYVYRRVSGTPDITKVTPITVQPCGLLEWQDGLSLAWAVVAIWLGVYALRYLGRIASH